MRLKRIAIIGPESTGKSELAEQLARHYQTKWVPEYAREYLEKIGRPYLQEDLLDIAKGQLASEDAIAKQSNGLVFCDTNLIVLKIWSDHSYGETHPWILEQLIKRKYDFNLLTDIDLPWKEDPLREHPDMREYFFKKYKDHLTDQHLPFAIVSGSGNARIESALNLIKGLTS